MQNPRLQLGLLLLLCGAALSVSAVKHVRHRKIHRKLFSHRGKQKTMQKSRAMGNGWRDDKSLEFGLSINFKDDAVLVSPNPTPPRAKPGLVKHSGCHAASDCECYYQRQPGRFIMRGRQSSGWYQLNFECKGVTFHVKATGEECKCDFRARVDRCGWARTWTETCSPQHCLSEYFKIGGSHQTSTVKGLTYEYRKMCDNWYTCGGWSHFIKGFENPTGKSANYYAYGNQDGRAQGTVSRYGYKWFFGLTFESRRSNKAKKTKDGKSIWTGNTIAGNWAPSSSGGQASFSQSMTWGKASEKQTQKNWDSSLAVTAGASYAGISVEMGVQHDWQEAASKTNSDTSGGSSENTCAAYQCEGGTTWQWKMDITTEKATAQVDNCLFVCTPNQGMHPKCPFGACCTSENRKDECATCSVLWCDPSAPDCPFNKDNARHEEYCGKTDQPFIDFLKMLRSRVLAWTLTRERQNYDFKTIEESVGIESRSQTMLQEAFRNFERVTTHKGKEKELEEKIREQLSNATIRLMTEQYQMAEEYLRVATSQAKHFDYEKSIKELLRAQDPCRDREKAETKPGSPVWCLCDANSKPIRFAAMDDPKVQAKMKDPKLSEKDKADLEEALNPSRCSDKHNKVRREKCIWKGTDSAGHCCSKDEGCAKWPVKKPDVAEKSLRITEIDLSEDDFSWSQLRRADQRLRMECYYQFETDGQKEDRIRTQQNLNGPNSETPQTTDIRKLTNPQKRRQRALLFRCFRRFFLTNQKKMFSIQKLDQMLIAEETSCADRLVNTDCVKRVHRSAVPDDLELEAGDGADTGEGGDAAELSGADSASFDRGDGVCCRKKDEERPKWTEECDDPGDKIIKSSYECRVTFEDAEEQKKKEEAAEKKDEEEAKKGDGEAGEEAASEGDGKDDNGKKDEDDKDKESLTKDSDKVQNNSDEHENTQKADEFKKEQDDVQKDRHGKVCCFMGKQSKPQYKMLSSDSDGRCPGKAKPRNGKC